MRRIALALVLAPAIASAADRAREHPAQKVASHTWVIHGPLGFPSPANQGFINNPAFVVTRDGVVIVDPGSSVQAGRMVLAQVRFIAHPAAIGGLTFRVHAPGKAHSGTDIMVKVIEEEVLFGGDNVLSRRIGGMDDATFRGSIAALKRALATGATVIVPGHGPSGGREVLERYRDYLRTIYEEVRRQALAGRSDFQIRPEVVRLLAAYRDWANFEDEVGRQIGFAVQEAESE